MTGIKIKDWKRKSTLSGGFYQSEYPSSAETLPAFEFEVKAWKPSAYAPGHMVEDPTAAHMKCPGCKAAGPVLDHGDTAQCPDCGLRMQLFGAALHVWR